MSLPHSNHDFDDELLSAYVDDELTVDERALVEERLRSDPHAAQFVQELRSLSKAIKSLPRETLGRDLRAEVRAEAERAKAETDEEDGVLPLTPPYDRWAGYKRGLAWSVLAIAATLMLMVVRPDEANEEAEVAKVDAPRQLERERAQSDAGPKLPPLGEMRADPRQRNLGMPAGATAASEAAPAAGAPSDANELADYSRQRDLAETKKFEERLELERAAEPSPPESASMDTLASDAEAPSAPAAAGAAVSGGAEAPRSNFYAAAEATPPVVELAVKSRDVITHFATILDGVEIDMHPERPEPANRAETPQLEGAIASAEVRRAPTEVESRQRLAKELTDAPEADQAEAEAAIMVQGSPAQIQRLVLACQSDEAVAEVRLQSDGKLDDDTRAGAYGLSVESPDFGGVDWRYDGGFGGAAGSDPAAGESQSGAATPLAAGKAGDARPFRGKGDVNGQAPRAVAWRVTPPMRTTDESGEKDKLAQRGARMKTPAPAAASTPRESTAALDEAAVGEAFGRLPANAPEQAPPEGQVRVLFVLRSAPEAAHEAAADELAPAKAAK